MKIFKPFKEIYKIIKKSSIWSRSLFLLFIVLLLLIIANRNNNSKQIEGFSQREKYVLKHNDDLYDNFYSKVYDKLMLDDRKNNYEVEEIMNNVKSNSSSILLDIGSGRGHQANKFKKNGMTVFGLDKSKSMIELSSKKYPNVHFKQGDALTFMNFKQNQFTHITCLYFTIYYIQNKQQFLQNCYQWLKPGGYLILHLVNRNKFDPIVNAADPLFLVSAQKYAKKRITNSTVKFNNFTYKANFNLENSRDIGTFKETFKDHSTKNIRENNHTLYMETQKSILSKAKGMGFIMKGKIDMVPCMYEYQYLYILYKPN
jgi:ubiquinone/menaquinone biosynthesis C-methylase UbiE